ncbi:MAG: UvrD-helicase domain-containing protein [Verrucomicrobiales bacterium]|nr:UvrD-helicase domain-containing protein [Verrucomicrobiales bacterium]
MSEEGVRIGSEIIEASAGSGKTYALTNRFIKLMAYGVPAERIVALTFTVKAAGEFFDAILEKLAKAASDAEAAKTLAKEVGREGFSQADFLRLLKELTRGMHRLTLGTLDSFFVRVVGAFPLEFGLGGEFSMMVDKAKIEAVRASVAERVFYEVVENKQALQEFLEAFKQATFGIEENSFFKNLDGFIADYQRLYLDVPAGERWGDARAIWPDGEWAVQGDGRAELNQALRSLLLLSPELGPEDKQQKRWQTFFEDSKKIVAGMALPAGVKYLTTNFFLQWTELREGSAKITIERKKIEFDAMACQAVADFVEALVAMNFAAKLKRTQGVWKVVDAYERCYDEKVRRRGQLQFEDVARVMGGEHGLTVGAENGVSFELAYRLDAQFDHWLLDEFQDTSRVQWRAIKDLVDEVVQDSEGRRSYFQVGDTKQSIYGWRGGDPKLFSEVVEHYRAGVEVKSLDESYRSGPAIIDTVNQVFSDRDTLQDLLSQEAVQAFHWKEHSCSHKTKALAGFVALWHPDVDKAKEEDVLDLMVRTVTEVDPLGRELSCAILCRSGGMVDKVMDSLREAGIDEVEGGAKVSIVSDNPVTLALLSLIKLAGHPGDRFAAGHLAMTPIAAWMKREGVSLRRLAMQTLTMIDGQGFEALLELWQQRLEVAGDLQDEFAQQRLSAFLQMAREFDETGDRSVDGFLEFAEGQKAKAQVSKKAIQVMTVHGSKGLGFDVVILPEIAGMKSLCTVDNGLSVGGSEEHPWVLDLPNKAFQELDPVLREHRQSLQAAAGFESLCVLYVAMTRAKQGLYMLAPRYGTSKALNFLALLEATLSEFDDEGERCATKVGGEGVVESYARGQREWYLEYECDERRVDAEDVGGEAEIELGMGQRRERRLTPSDHGASQYGAELLFSARGADARVFGNQVHALFEQIEWLPQGGGLPLFLTESDGGDTEARRHVRCALRESCIADLLLEPADGVVAELWREKAFELLLSDGWVSGVFDRVVLLRDAGSGDLLRAEIIDYKTSRVEGELAITDEVEVYRAQMELYQEALMKLTGLAEKDIRCLLVFTQPRVTCELNGR